MGFYPHAALAKRRSEDTTNEAATTSDTGARRLAPPLALDQPDLTLMPADPHLARVINAWPTLPEPIRRAILALIDTM